MIFTRFALVNPWWKYKNSASQIDYFSYEKMVTKHKFLEIQISKGNPCDLLSLIIDTCWFGQDHAGFEFTVEILGYYFSIQFRDHRHWNHRQGRFMTEEEITAEYEEWKKENE